MAAVQIAELVHAEDRVALLGTPVDRVEQELLADLIDAFIESGAPHQIVTANLDFLAIAQRRPQFRRTLAEASLVLCDGKPLQWASKIRGYPIPARITGTDLLLTSARLSAERGYRLYFMGAAEGVAVRAARRLEQLVPGVMVSGTHSPAVGFSDEESAEIIERIRAAKPDVLFVALGAPRQDEWIHDHLRELEVPVCAGIGGVFNFMAGETRRAPEWVQQVGMEWAFRLVNEPQRLWRRYLLNDLPLFFRLVMSQVWARWQENAPTRMEHVLTDEVLTDEVWAPRA